ncbi:hypothetical protein [Klebsiella michiganensis]|uniref:hypothetical protein n=1 Tax=Klebsiella michiganensis TaxID=1134687 RepID=UPI00164378E7|nr:hypothetical protein [Klebsiella michiganensis]MBC3631656.1 hypothetical protein [Klebsiella michiganensis]
MNLVHFTTNINLFLPHPLLAPESKSIIKLMPFIEDGFLPSHGEAINSDTGMTSKIIRVDKDINDAHITLAFTPWAINIRFESRNSLDSEFLKFLLTYVYELLEKTFSFDEVRFHRVATIITNAFEYESNLESSIYNKFFKGENIPFEWSLKQARESIEGDHKIFNVININKGYAVVSFKVQVYEGDAIVISIDNNSRGFDDNFRFTLNDKDVVSRLLTQTLEDISTFGV